MSPIPSLVTKSFEEPNQKRQQIQQILSYLGFNTEQQEHIQININGSSYPQTYDNQQQIEQNYNESDTTLRSYFESFSCPSDEEDSIQQQTNITPFQQISTSSNNEELLTASVQPPLQNPLYDDQANICNAGYTYINQYEGTTVLKGEQEQQFNEQLPLTTGYTGIRRTAETNDQFATQELPQQVYLAPLTEQVTAEGIRRNNTGPSNYVNMTNRRASTTRNRHSRTKGPVPAQTVKLPNGRIKCIPCNKDFANNGYATQHNNNHHSGDLPHRCDHCGKRFLKKEKMEAHQATHDIANKPFKCQYCDKRYAHKFDLQRHCNTRHDSIKNFACDVCTKTFGRKDHLLTHKHTHYKTYNASNETCSKQ